MAASFSPSLKNIGNKLNNLEAKLLAENESRKRDNLQLDFSKLEIGRRPRPAPLDGIRPNSASGSPSRGSPQRRLRISSAGSPCRTPRATTTSSSHLDSAEIERKLQEIMKLTGILTINITKYHCELSDLVNLGEIGSGTCGQVYRMKHKDSNRVFAVKQMRRTCNRDENKRILMDLEVVLKSHDSPYIVQCYGCFITPSDVWICMEEMSTCLEKLMKKLKAPIPEEILGKLAVAIVKALDYLKEEHGVIHRDVKPSNILLDSTGTVKLCDFGISGRLVDSKARTRSAGCAAYMAPERIDPPDPTNPNYDVRADVWSFGISLVELATGEFPYKNCKTDFEVLTKVLQEEPPSLPSRFSQDFCSFVQTCLTKDFHDRPKYKELLSHSFIRRYEAAQVDVASWFADVVRQRNTLPR